MQRARRSLSSAAWLVACRVVCGRRGCAVAQGAGASVASHGLGPSGREAAPFRAAVGGDAYGRVCCCSDETGAAECEVQGRAARALVAAHTSGLALRPPLRLLQARFQAGGDVRRHHAFPFDYRPQEARRRSRLCHEARDRLGGATAPAPPGVSRWLRRLGTRRVARPARKRRKTPSEAAMW